MTQRVLIVGAGSGGLAVARRLGRRGGDAVAVTLVDRTNHHLFQPLLDQVATAGLNPQDIAYSVRRNAAVAELPGRLRFVASSPGWRGCGSTSSCSSGSATA